jgi:peptide/nickel transport system permease protein
MFTYTLRRLAFAVPTVLIISLVVFLMLDMAPGDPTSSLPLTIPQEVREEIRMALGLGEPVFIRYVKWLQMMVINEPLHLIAGATGWDIAPEGPRILSWQTRSPVGDIIVQRIPQTLWVVGLGYLFGILIAVPIGVISAYKQYSWFDQVGTFVSMVGFSVPTFFTGVVFILIFSVWLGWFPSMYDTTLRVTDWSSFVRPGQPDRYAGGGAGAL